MNDRHDNSAETTFGGLPKQYFVVAALFLGVGVVNLLVSTLGEISVIKAVVAGLEIVIGTGLLLTMRAAWTAAIVVTAIVMISAGVSLLTLGSVVPEGLSRTEAFILYGLVILVGVWQYRVLIRSDVCAWYQARAEAR